MSTYTFFDSIERAQEWAESQDYVNAIEPYTSGYGSNATEGYRVERFRGMVVDEDEKNGYHDSDFFAIWFDKETGRSGRFMFGTTRAATYSNGCVIDADDETKAAYVLAKQKARDDESARRAAREEEAAAQIPEKGKRVRVTSKRSKVPHGTEGEVFWFGKSGYARAGYRNKWAMSGDFLFTKSELILNKIQDYRVGFKTADGEKHFCAATCVEIMEEVEA